LSDKAATGDFIESKEDAMFRRILGFALAITAFAIFAVLTVYSISRIGSNVSGYTAKVNSAHASEWEGDGVDHQIIPAADLWEIQQRAISARTRAAREQARVQAVLDYIKEHRRFPPRTQPFDSAQQVVMDYIRLRNQVPSNAAQVDPPAKAVLDYIRVNHAMPPHTEPIDPAVQDVMDYIRVYSRVPTSAESFRLP
jgi:hypothetical protein